jgi:hypothetical protein
LGPILQHIDDIDHVRSLFLIADFDDSLRLISPTLLEAVVAANSDSAAQLTTVDFHVMPLDDIVLQSNKVLYLDHHTHIFIWSGLLTLGLKNAQSAPTLPSPMTTFNEMKRQQCLELAKRSALYRFPQPEVLQFKVSGNIDFCISFLFLFVVVIVVASASASAVCCYSQEASSMARWLQCRLVPSHKDTLEEQLQSFPQLAQLAVEERNKLMAKFHRTDDLSFNQYLRGLFK